MLMLRQDFNNAMPKREAFSWFFVGIQYCRSKYHDFAFSALSVRGFHI